MQRFLSVRGVGDNAPDHPSIAWNSWSTNRSSSLPCGACTVDAEENIRRPAGRHRSAASLSGGWSGPFRGHRPSRLHAFRLTLSFSPCERERLHDGRRIVPSPVGRDAPQRGHGRVAPPRMKMCRVVAIPRFFGLIFRTGVEPFDHDARPLQMTILASDVLIIDPWAAPQILADTRGAVGCDALGDFARWVVKVAKEDGAIACRLAGLGAMRDTAGIDPRRT